jgi:L,D-transpeptidase-like protein
VIKSPRPRPRRPARPRSNPIPENPSAPGGRALDGRGRRGLVVSACLALLAIFAACKTPPVAELARARTRLEQARRDGIARYAPEEMTEAEKAVREAEREIALQSARAPFRRDYRVAATFLERARFYLLHARNEARERRERAERAASEQIRDLVDSLARARDVRRLLTPKDPQVNRLLVGADVDLELAQKNLQERDFTEALAAAESGNRRVHQVEQILLSSMVRFTTHPDLPSWRKWVDDAMGWSRAQRGAAFVVDKLRRRLTIYQAGRPDKVYSVDLGLGGMERKLRSGDDATPEGFYHVQEIRGPGQTQYHRAFLLDYPNAIDRKRFDAARRAGEIPRGADPGGLIEIHGEGGRDKDWTRGCVALTNAEMDELVKLVRVGTPVAIVGYNPRDPEDPL